MEANDGRYEWQEPAAARRRAMQARHAPAMSHPTQQNQREGEAAHDRLGSGRTCQRAPGRRGGEAKMIRKCQPTSAGIAAGGRLELSYRSCPFLNHDLAGQRRSSRGRQQATWKRDSDELGGWFRVGCILCSRLRRENCWRR